MAEEPVAMVMARYERWLSEQRLSAATRRSYRRWVSELLEDLAGTDPQRSREALRNTDEHAAADRLIAAGLLEDDHGVLRPTPRAEATFRAPPDRRHLR